MPRGVRKPIVPQVPGQAPSEDVNAAPEAVNAEPGVASKPADGGLPSQDEIDRTKITRPVLTRDGWVLPVDRPAPQFARG